MDDGIELNFAVGGGVQRVKAPKGGRWTDRFAARKVAKKNVKYAAKFSDGVSTNSGPGASPRAPIPLASTAEPPATPISAGRSETAPAQIDVASSSGLPRPRVDHGVVDDSLKAQAVLSGGSSAEPSRQRPVNQPKTANIQGKAPQYISSLFSSNPHHKPSKPSASSVPSAATNAPLPADLNTFAGLGLDPLLVHHLKQKMGLGAPTGIQKSCLPYLLSKPLDTSSTHVNDDENEDRAASERAASSSPKGKEKALPAPSLNGLRDVLIQSQTGSGKTLSYLLPIIQTLLPLSKLSYIDRSIGTLAFILAPTRELAQQIEKVLEQLLSMALSLPDTDNENHYTRWLVSGLFTGGATKTHEKARLRKGVPIVVATPGRLLDHLQNTSTFQCGKTMFLVLDEADRLMDLGFEETITGIIKALDGRRKLMIAAEKEQDEVGGGNMRWPFWDRGRTTMLCSATVDAKVEKLAGTSLRDPIVFRSFERPDKQDNGRSAREPPLIAKARDLSAVELPQSNAEKFTPPAQLSQRYIVVPTKLRLVALVALLRSLITSIGKDEGNKIIVFLSSTDSVDYHWRLLGAVKMDDSTSLNESPQAISLSSPLFPQTTIQRLHGSLPLAMRKASLGKFIEASASPSILLATSVASRGLDLPLVRSVIQYDLPSEGGANEYVHRVGRTARAGKGGEAWAFVGPAEIAWVSWVEGKMGDTSASRSNVRLSEIGVEEVLRKGFGGSGYEYEARATDVQLAFERWVLSSPANATLARKAFGSFIRAYSTHPLEEKQFFHPKSLHLGHLAKSFALRETPSSLGGSTRPNQPKTTKASAAAEEKKRKRENESSDDDEPVKKGKESTARNKTEERMYAAVRKAGRNVKSGGAMGEFAREAGRSGDAEFQVMDGNEIERMLAGKS